jgi:hypothetical protein
MTKPREKSREALLGEGSLCTVIAVPGCTVLQVYTRIIAAAQNQAVASRGVNNAGFTSRSRLGYTEATFLQ